LKPVTIISRLGQIEGVGNDEIVYFDTFDDEANKKIRHFILLNEGIKLMYEPWGWKNEWYADLIKVERHNEHMVELFDMYIDIIIEGNGPTYRIIDLEEYADAVTGGNIPLNEIKPHFIQLQLFLDNYLHRGRVFPPKLIKDLMEDNE
jgi:hypothetical protein